MKSSTTIQDHVVAGIDFEEDEYYYDENYNYVHSLKNKKNGLSHFTTIKTDGFNSDKMISSQKIHMIKRNSSNLQFQDFIYSQILEETFKYSDL